MGINHTRLFEEVLSELLDEKPNDFLASTVTIIDGKPTGIVIVTPGYI